MANELKQVYGSATTVISLAATLSSGANTYTGLTGLTNTQLDNSLNYPDAKAILGIADTFAAAPTAGGTVDLYMVEDDIDGTGDETPEPAATDILYLATYVGSWVVDNQDVAMIKPINISLKGIRKARYFIVNNTGQQISYTSAATTVKITPFSVAPT
jgi:hypothetical protein